MIERTTAIVVITGCLEKYEVANKRYAEVVDCWRS